MHSHVDKRSSMLRGFISVGCMNDQLYGPDPPLQEQQAVNLYKLNLHQLTKKLIHATFTA
jgi:hypothetical protein